MDSCYLLQLRWLFWPAQIAFMQTLMAEGVADKKDIVFLDMDVLVVDSLAEASNAALTVAALTCLCPMLHMYDSFLKYMHAILKSSAQLTGPDCERRVT